MSESCLNFIRRLLYTITGNYARECEGEKMEKEEAIKKAIKLVSPGASEGDYPTDKERKLLFELNEKLGEYAKQLEIDKVSLKTNSESWGIIICMCLAASKDPNTTLKNALTYYAQRNSLNSTAGVIKNLANDLESE